MRKEKIEVSKTYLLNVASDISSKIRENNKINNINQLIIDEIDGLKRRLMLEYDIEFELNEDKNYFDFSTSDNYKVLKKITGLLIKLVDNIIKNDLEFILIGLDEKKMIVDGYERLDDQNVQLKKDNVTLEERRKSLKKRLIFEEEKNEIRF